MGDCGRSKMAVLQTEIISHTRKVCSLYKKAARTLQCWTPDRLSFRYEVTILRDRFEQNRNLTDVAKLQKVLQESEKNSMKSSTTSQSNSPIHPAVLHMVGPWSPLTGS